MRDEREVEVLEFYEKGAGTSRGRFAGTHGNVLNVHTFFSACRTTHHTTPAHCTPVWCVVVYCVACVCVVRCCVCVCEACARCGVVFVCVLCCVCGWVERRRERESERVHGDVV